MYSRWDAWCMKGQLFGQSFGVGSWKEWDGMGRNWNVRDQRGFIKVKLEGVLQRNKGLFDEKIGMKCN